MKQQLRVQSLAGFFGRVITIQPFFQFALYHRSNRIIPRFELNDMGALTKISARQSSSRSIRQGLHFGRTGFSKTFKQFKSGSYRLSIIGSTAGK